MRYFLKTKRGFRNKIAKRFLKMQECPICNHHVNQLYKWDNDECIHEFCELCTRELRQRNFGCPMCRRPASGRPVYFRILNAQNRPAGGILNVCVSNLLELGEVILSVSWFVILSIASLILAFLNFITTPKCAFACLSAVLVFALYGALIFTTSLICTVPRWNDTLIVYHANGTESARFDIREVKVHVHNLARRLPCTWVNGGRFETLFMEPIMKL